MCGPPAGGKSTYVRAQASPGDVVIDMDAIVRELGYEARTDDWAARRLALLERNRRLVALANERDARAAWFITTAPNGGAREEWARKLRSRKTILVLTPKRISAARIMADSERAAHIEGQMRALERWWEFYYPSPRDTVLIEPVRRTG